MIYTRDSALLTWFFTEPCITIPSGVFILSLLSPKSLLREKQKILLMIITSFDHWIIYCEISVLIDPPLASILYFEELEHIMLLEVR